MIQTYNVSAKLPNTPKPVRNTIKAAGAYRAAVEFAAKRDLPKPQAGGGNPQIGMTFPSGDVQISVSQKG